jgi:hypothetical protein
MRLLKSNNVKALNKLFLEKESDSKIDEFLNIGRLPCGREWELSLVFFNMI